MKKRERKTGKYYDKFITEILHEFFANILQCGESDAKTRIPSTQGRIVLFP